jgi:hypothetical protein
VYKGLFSDDLTISIVGWDSLGYIRVPVIYYGDIQGFSDRLHSLG